jgi:hypothetical protein
MTSDLFDHVESVTVIDLSALAALEPDHSLRDRVPEQGDVTRSHAIEDGVVTRKCFLLTMHDAC